MYTSEKQKYIEVLQSTAHQRFKEARFVKIAQIFPHFPCFGQKAGNSKTPMANPIIFGATPVAIKRFLLQTNQQKKYTNQECHGHMTRMTHGACS